MHTSKNVVYQFMNNTVIIESLCFFTVGLLVLSLILSFVLLKVFKQRVFVYYFSYIILAILFIVSVVFTQLKVFPASPTAFVALTFIFDVVQVPLFLLHTFFIYKILTAEIQQLDRFVYFIRLYFSFSFCYFIFRLILKLDIISVSNNIQSYINIFYWAQYLSVPFLILFRLWQNRNNTYIRYLFIGSVLMLSFCILTYLDSLVFNYSIFKGLQFLLLGIIADSIFFNLAFIYKSYQTQLEKAKEAFETKAKITTLHLEIQQQTLQELSKELHDNVGQKLTLASLYNQQLILESDIATNNNTIINIGEIIDESLQELRNISKSLTSKYIEENSLKFLLIKEINKIEKTKKYSINSNIDEVAIDSVIKKTIIVRVVQEFFQNAIKYANCTQLSLHLTNTQQDIDIILKDNGIGFDYDAEKIYAGNGINNIKSRVALIAGTFTITSVSNAGTTLQIQIPNT